MDNMANWVQMKPMILIRFDEAASESLAESRNGFEHLTLVEPHANFREVTLPTICLLEVQEHDGTKCYLATATRKVAVSTFDSRLTIKKLRRITTDSLKGVKTRITDARMRRFFEGRIPVEGELRRLSPKLSAHVAQSLSRDPDNRSAFDTALSLIPQLRRVNHAQWAQEDAISLAMAAFGLRGTDTPNQVALKRGSSSGLSLIGAHLYEDNVVHAEASRLPGFDAIAPDVTGRAVFERAGERLVIYTANKLPLEHMLGVDLIYINETRGNIVMVQYKMLEEVKSECGGRDWIFRPNRQLHQEISRMRLPEFAGSPRDYRLNKSPFFFKFVKRKVVDDSHQAFLISLDHLSQILADPTTKGARNGVRVSYDALDGTYLREADMLSLIRSGYVGTHRDETEALATIVAGAAKGNRAMVLAWQRRVQDGRNANMIGGEPA